MTITIKVIADVVAPIRCQAIKTDHAAITIPWIISHSVSMVAQVLTHCGLGDFNEILDEYFSSQLQWLMAEIPAMKNVTRPYWW